jgi:hypothetical protein
MPPQIPSVGERDQVTSEKKTRHGGHGARNFVHWTPEEQQQAFFAWLPQELHDAPGMNWRQPAPEIKGYCVNTIGDSPDSAILAVIAASMTGALPLTTLRGHVKNVTSLLREFRATGLIHQLPDLKEEHIWITWAAQQEQARKERARHCLSSYIAVAQAHFPSYLRRLSHADRQRMRQYALPLPPGDLSKTYFPFQKHYVKQQAERKATTDTLVPLYPVLRQLVRLRKELAQRVLLAFREARRKVEAGEAILPSHFQHTDVFPEVNRDARTIAEVQLQGREVVMHFILWDKRTWVKRHPNRYSEASASHARRGKEAYAQEQNCFFVEFDGGVSDCLWSGDLIEHRTLQKFTKWDSPFPEPEDYQSRWEYARQLGFPNGCACGPRGLLDTGDRWFSLATERGKTLIFEPESLYRGVLFGSALAMFALSNGSRMSELLQVSWNKERRVIRTETVVVLGEDGQPQHDETGKPVTKQVKLHFQYLLPKGGKSEEERQLFPLSKEALRLLGEIKLLLEQTHGEVPIVAPSRSHAKYEQLQPERYLFQWNASPDGEAGALRPSEVQTLLRFILHGLDRYTTHGKPIRVCVHVLRHVMATHARHHRNVPPEAIAYFFLHHRLRELTGRNPSLPELTEYYTRMTEDQRFAIISADLEEQEEMDHALLQAAPSPLDLQQMNEDLRIIFDLWHALHPTAFGYCGCPGLCPRGNDRALCLGCSYLVTDPERLGAARSWRDSYERQAKMLEGQGNAVDARQARIKVQLLDDVINVMRLQLQAEASGSYVPLHKVLPSPYSTREKQHEAEA